MRSIALIVPLVAAACSSETEFYERTGTDTWYQTPTDKVDILFVVDDSHSMAEEQEALAQGFGSFISEIESTNTDFHLGVISTSFEYDDPDRGKLIGDPPVLTRADDYQSIFTERVVVGIAGSDREKGLEAAAYALSPVMLAGANAGFIRQEAYLLLVFVSDENDCSDRGALEQEAVSACYEQQDRLVPVEDFVQEFQNRKEQDDFVLVGSIVGPPKDDGGGCPDAVPGFRYIDAAHLTGGLVGNICDTDWSDVMWEMGLNATGVHYTFLLSDPARPDTIEVFVDEQPVPESPEDGWTYDEETWYLVFHGDALPPRGSTIVANYVIAHGG